jgi:hypothetical protein
LVCLFGYSTGKLTHAFDYIDTVGYFPQMIFAAMSALTILFIILGREISKMNVQQHDEESEHRELVLPGPPMSPRSPRSPSRQLGFRPPAIPSPTSNSFEISQYEAHRLIKHMRGEYVFPPVQVRHTVTLSGVPHRRTKTLASVRE